ncbi:hypothetical protein D3C76_873720 [compost metagenome]
MLVVPRLCPLIPPVSSLIRSPLIACCNSLIEILLIVSRQIQPDSPPAQFIRVTAPRIIILFDVGNAVGIGAAISVCKIVNLFSMHHLLVRVYGLRIPENNGC